MLLWLNEVVKWIWSCFFSVTLVSFHLGSSILRWSNLLNCQMCSKNLERISQIVTCIDQNSEQINCSLCIIILCRMSPFKHLNDRTIYQAAGLHTLSSGTKMILRLSYTKQWTEHWHNYTQHWIRCLSETNQPHFKLYLLGFKTYIKCMRVAIITITHALEHEE